MNPATGTFTFMDTYGGSVFDPTSLHKYLYANDNPVSYTDPSGYFSLPELSASMTIMEVLDFTLFSAVVGFLSGFVIGTVDSLLGGNSLKQALMDGLKAGGWGACIGAVIGALMCWGTVCALATGLLQIGRFVLLGFGLYGAIISADEGNTAQAVFRALVAIFACYKMGKAIEGIDLIRTGTPTGENGWSSQKPGANNAPANDKPVRTLYRGDRSSTLDDVFENGFQSKGTHNDALLHTKSNTTAGNFVSTTSEQDVALGFAGSGRRGYLYVIKTDNYVDINATYGSQAYYPEQCEFSIPGGVPSSDIVGAYPTSDHAISGDFIPNPNYGGN